MKLEKQIRSHKKWIGFGILLVLSILLYIQHRHVYMYFDDYGYASLTYGNDQYYNDGILTFSNLINYLVWHYNNWGGRILCFFLEISLLHIGVDAVRIVQSVLIAGILLFSVRLIRPSHKRWLTLLVLVLSLYFSWTLQVYRDGVFWFSASISYIWAICPFFAAVFLQRKYHEEGGNKLFLAGFLFFLAAFSQEQIAVMVIICQLCIFGYRRFVKRKRGGAEFVCLLCAIVGGAIELLAPGNFMRSADARYEEFEVLNLVGKILHNLPSVVDINVGESNQFITVFAVLASALVFWSHGTMRKRIAAKILAALELLLAVGALAATFALPGKSRPSVALLLAWIVAFCVEAIVDFVVDKNIYFLGLWVGGIFSQGMMLVSPSISTRCCIPFLFVLDMMIAYFVWKYVRIDALLYGITGIVFLISIFNAAEIYRGYKSNSETHKINDAIMRVSQVAIEQGVQMEEITLYRLQNDKYANSMAYQSWADFIEYWLKYYYRIPQDVKVVWTDPLL